VSVCGAVRATAERVVSFARLSFSMLRCRGASHSGAPPTWSRRWGHARGDGRVVGYLCLWEVAGELHITNVAVHPTVRRRGIARTLLGGVLDDARQRGLRLVVLEVRPSNAEALGLYDSFGFRVVGRRRGYYYDTGEDALVMEADLQAAQPGSRA